MIVAKNKNGKNLTSRVSHPDAAAQFPPHGEPFVMISFTRWFNFTGRADDPENDKDQIFFSVEDARRLRDKLARAIHNAR